MSSNGQNSFASEEICQQIVNFIFSLLHHIKLSLSDILVPIMESDYQNYCGKILCGNDNDEKKYSVFGLLPLKGVWIRTLQRGRSV